MGRSQEHPRWRAPAKQGARDPTHQSLGSTSCVLGAAPLCIRPSCCYSQALAHSPQGLEPSPALLGFMLRDSLFLVSEATTLTPCTLGQVPLWKGNQESGAKGPIDPQVLMEQNRGMLRQIQAVPSRGTGDRGSGCSHRPTAQVLCWLWKLIGQEAGPA